ncbi:hypothetical protein MtrunA17_Chr2g0323311 [Medicago truncatula]|uniref:Transmembrane protein, putative n=1 Tax=Medicago truncatula TaxID=3880 RepID=G7IRL7_MEDTR|nr:uncharacterized protein LOC11422127 isoform X1 [Medicago truncatula]AES67326.1 transmembrane protein, putative [Medicago truncatula]RHN75627.1 hypothetical protein MtrunA17_Chr2g0323311 [Medicago truncatula]
MKSVSKNKFLTCFRPVIDLDDMLESETVPAPSTSRRKHATQNSATNSMSLDQNSPKSIQNQVAGHPPKQTLSKVIKAVMFQIILNTRANKKNLYSQTCFGSKRNYSLHTRSSSSFKTNIEEIKAIESPLSSPSSSYSPVFNSKSLSKSNESQFENQKKFHCLGIYMVFLISLVVTVCWGKVNVIVLTSMFFCCFCLCNTCSHQLKRVGKSRKDVSSTLAAGVRSHPRSFEP